jgi:ubiquinone biosynthesis monooxygenase Coq7|tara:strand:- start:1797 stop:2324 length:528 start_codon:yes stop_codon:yes gene_type:complete
MKKIDKKIAEIIRVNHAGELGAQKIYTSQIKFTKDIRLKKKLQKIASEEKKHFDYFNNKITENRVRPTIMSPVWGFLGTTLGALSSNLGKNYVNACTESVEEVIVEHYKSQLIYFQKNKIKGNLEKMIKKFCDEEDKHRREAIKSSLQKEDFALKTFKKLTKLGTKLAIEVSKKL